MESRELHGTEVHGTEHLGDLSHLRAKDDGRKRSWFSVKIEELERELSELRGGVTTSTEARPTDREAYADGFLDCMHRFQIMNKAARQNIHRQILARGKDAVKRLAPSKFRGFTS